MRCEGEYVKWIECMGMEWSWPISKRHPGIYDCGTSRNTCHFAQNSGLKLVPLELN